MLLTDRPKGFQNSSVIETGLEDFHNVAVRVMSTTFEKLKPRGGYVGEFSMKQERTVI